MLSTSPGGVGGGSSRTRWLGRSSCRTVSWSARGGIRNMATGTPKQWRLPPPVTGLEGRRWSSRSSPARIKASSRRAPTRSSVPACAGSLRRCGIPNPVAAGGSEQLRAAGVEVELGASAAAAAAQNAIFLHTLRDPNRPYVALKLATTLDGRIADGFGRSRWISGKQASEYVQWLRAGFDAIGIGGRTARFDDPSLTVRGPVRPRVPPAEWSSTAPPIWTPTDVGTDCERNPHYRRRSVRSRSDQGTAAGRRRRHRSHRRHPR